MTGFLRRINRLIARLTPLGPRLLTLFYKDGAKRTVDDWEAFGELMSGRVTGFHCHDAEDEADGFYDALMSGCHDIHELWADGDDSDMLPEEDE